MSYEFVAPIHDEMAPETFARFLADLLHTGRYVSESSSVGKVNLRFAGQTRRDIWPEDFTIRLDSQQITVAIHAGNAGNREQCLHDIAGTFRTLGIPLEFEEG